LNSEARLEQEYRNGLHHFYGVDLISEQSLLSPHASHQKFFVFKEKRKGPYQQIDAALERLFMAIFSYDLVLRRDIMHHSDNL
jgi:hypothetical protein